jgi:hypothetical protein
MNLHLLVIKTSSAHNLHFSTRLKNLSTPMHGSVLLSPSLRYYPHHVQKQIRHFFAAQQFRGTARIWWDHYSAMPPEGHVVTWEEFRTTFRAHHIPEGIIERKLNEFLALTQGTCTII